MSSARRLMFAGAVAALLPTMSSSQDSPKGYVKDAYPGGQVVTSGTGQCVQTGFWHQGQSVEACDPNAQARSEPQPVAKPEPVQQQPEPVAQTAQPQPEPAQTETAIAQPAPAQPEPEPAAAQPLPTNPRLETSMLPQTVHYSTDAFFDFDESTLKPQGRAALDDLVRQLGDVDYGKVVVVGHTDRIGSAEYNQELSERRANAVRNYLLRHSIPGDRIEAVGKGKSEPTVKTADCSGPKSAKVVACLQPDRRVDIEVSGTKESTTGSR